MMAMMMILVNDDKDDDAGNDDTDDDNDISASVCNPTAEHRHSRHNHEMSGIIISDLINASKSNKGRKLSMPPCNAFN